MRYVDFCILVELLRIPNMKSREMLILYITRLVTYSMKCHEICYFCILVESLRIPNMKSHEMLILYITRLVTYSMKSHEIY